MTDPLKEAYCCCQLFYIRQGIFLIAAHSFLQATFGILVVVTSHYQKKYSTLNTIVIAANISFFPAGIFVFATTLYNSYKAVRLSVFFFIFVTVFNFGAAACYIFWYNDFRANSELDKIFFWRNNQDWVNDGELPFTFWHVLAFSTLIVLILWLYYSYQLWKFSNLLKIKKYSEPRESDSTFTSRRSKSTILFSRDRTSID